MISTTRHVNMTWSLEMRELDWVRFGAILHLLHASFWCATRRIFMRDMTHSYVRHDSFVRVTWLVVWRCWSCIGCSFRWATWLILTCDTTHFYCVMWLILTRDTTFSLEMLEPYWVRFPMGNMPHSYVRGQHASFLCSWATCLILMFDTICFYVWHDSFSFVTWLILICDMTHSHLWHDSFLFVTWLILVCNMTHSYLWHDSSMCVMWFVVWKCWSHIGCGIAKLLCRISKTLLSKLGMFERERDR